MAEALALLTSVLDTKLVAICVLKAVRDENGQISDFQIELVNKEMERMTGRNDMEGKLFGILWPGIIEYGIMDVIVRVFRSGHPRQIEYHYQLDGFDNWYQSMFVKTKDGIVATHLDITDRKKAEIKLKDLEAKKNKEIYEASISAQEKERDRIAESLHNGLGQLLYAAKLSIDNMRPEVKDDIDGTGKSKALAQKLLSEAIIETRRISHILSPTILKDFGLKAAIEDTCDQFRTIAEINLAYSGYRKLNHAVELVVYRSVQELLHNMAKHSKASKCSVLLYVKQNGVLLSIHDNGIGFDGTINKGLGLNSIKGQVALLQGDFLVTSSVGKGTTTLIHIPISPNDVKEETKL